MQDVLPVIAVIVSMAAAIAALRIFFTLWTPLDRWMNGDRFAARGNAQLSALKDKTVDIHLKSGTLLEKVVILGYPLTHPQSPIGLRQLLAVQFREGHEGYVRMDEIEYIAENKW